VRTVGCHWWQASKVAVLAHATSLSRSHVVVVQINNDRNNNSLEEEGELQGEVKGEEKLTQPTIELQVLRGHAGDDAKLLLSFIGLIDHTPSLNV